METPFTEPQTSAEPIPASDATASRPAPAPVPATFAEMHLKVGDKIPIEIPRGVKGERTLGKVIGWVEGSSFLITLPQRIIMAGLLKDGEHVLLRAFTGRSAFAFSTTVLKIEHYPFTYLHLRFPEKIEAVTVRGSFRHGVRLPATIAAGDKTGITGAILNIGTAGARISITEALADESSLQLATRFELQDVPVVLELSALVRSSKSTTDAQGVTHYEYGVEFTGLQPNDHMALGNLLWYQMYMYPEGVA